MFTGLITDLGQVIHLDNNQGFKVAIKTGYDLKDIKIGASIACCGVCLTVVGKAEQALLFDVSEETLNKTNLQAWAVGTAVNLEKSLRVGDELGGHLVSGHVDCTAVIKSIKDEGISRRFVIAMPEAVAPFIAEKGSVALDGVSLTVNKICDDGFDVNIVPHTFNVTAFQYKAVGDQVNLEVDLFARYLARIHSYSNKAQ